MPELPEVEVIKRELQEVLTERGRGHRHIEKIEFLRKNLRHPIPIKKIKKIEGAQLQSVERRAKYLIFRTDHGDLLSHLGMTGSWRHVPALDQVQGHDHIRIFFSDGSVWIYNDPRRFGLFELLDPRTEKLRLSHLGPEPLSSLFSGESLWKSLRGKSSSIKAALMDQKVVVGVGNIYACEALFAAKVRPNLPAHLLSRSRAEVLAEAIKLVLEKAIRSGGSTISDYRKINGASGGYQNEHQVYGRAGLACRLCATPIRSKVIAGRSTFWCPVCQK